MLHFPPSAGRIPCLIGRCERGMDKEPDDTQVSEPSLFDSLSPISPQQVSAGPAPAVTPLPPAIEPLAAAIPSSAEPVASEPDQSEAADALAAVDPEPTSSQPIPAPAQEAVAAVGSLSPETHAATSDQSAIADDTATVEPEPVSSEPVPAPTMENVVTAVTPASEADRVEPDQSEIADNTATAEPEPVSSEPVPAPTIEPVVTAVTPAPKADRVEPDQSAIADDSPVAELETMSLEQALMSGTRRPVFAAVDEPPQSGVSEPSTPVNVPASLADQPLSPQLAGNSVAASEASTLVPMVAVASVEAAASVAATLRSGQQVAAPQTPSPLTTVRPDVAAPPADLPSDEKTPVATTPAVSQVNDGVPANLTTPSSVVSPQPVRPVVVQPSTGAWWTIPMVCVGLGIVACALIIGQVEENRRVAWQRNKLKSDVEYFQKQIRKNDEFIKRIQTDPNLAERLAQLQMRQVREGLAILEVPGLPHQNDRNPFQLATIPPPPPFEPYKPRGDLLTQAFIDQRTGQVAPRKALCGIGFGLMLVAIGLVMGGPNDEARPEPDGKAER